MLVLLQPQERARQPHPRRGKHKCNVPIRLPRLMDDKWKNVKLELVVNSCRPRGRCKRLAGKIWNSRRAALTSAKQISVSISVLQDSKHSEKISVEGRVWRRTPRCKAQMWRHKWLGIKFFKIIHKGRKIHRSINAQKCMPWALCLASIILFYATLDAVLLRTNHFFFLIDLYLKALFTIFIFKTYQQPIKYDACYI